MSEEQKMSEDKVLLFIGENPFVETGMGIVAKQMLVALTDEFTSVIVYAWNHDVQSLEKSSWIIVPALADNPYKGHDLSKEDYEQLEKLVVSYKVTHIVAQGDALYFVGLYRLRERMFLQYGRKVVVVEYLNIDGEDVPDTYMGHEFVDKVIVSSQFAKKELQKVLALKDIDVVYHGVDLDLFKPVNMPAADNRPVVFGSVGVGGIRKNLEALVILVKDLKQEKKNIVMQILTTRTGKIAEYVWREEVQDYVKLFYQPISRKELASFYSSLDVYVQPTFGEGFGLPVLEAMACGIPVIAANNSSMPELVSKDRGMLVDCNSTVLMPNVRLVHKVISREELKRVSEEMIRLVKKGRTKLMRENCRKFAQQFSWETFRGYIKDAVLGAKYKEFAYAGVEPALQIRTASRRVVTQRSVAIVKVGGIGDNLQTVPLIKALKKKYGAGLLVDMYVEKMGEVFNYTDAHGVAAFNFYQANIVRSLINIYPEVYDVRYVSLCLHDAKIVQSDYFTKYERFFWDWTALNPRLHILNKHVVDIMLHSLGLQDFASSEDVRASRLPAKLYPQFENAIVLAPDYGLIRTKQYSAQFWSALIKKIKEIYKEPIVIVGNYSDLAIELPEGVIDLRGKTHLNALMSIIAYAKLIVSIEGGVHWLAKFFDKKAVVLFASTPKVLYGFKGHTNLGKEECMPCWWSGAKEPQTCLMGEQYCVNCISANEVIRAL